MIDIKKFNEFKGDNESSDIKVKTKVVSAFPGTGKSTFHNENKETTLDSDSSNFSWIIDDTGEKVRNPEFPNNYIQHIKDNIGKYEYIFVSSHEDVRNLLLDNCIFFYIVYPSIDRKEEFIERYKNRGNDDKFIKLLDSNWDEWLEQIHGLGDGCCKYELGSKLNISDFISDKFKK